MMSKKNEILDKDTSEHLIDDIFDIFFYIK